MPVGNEPSWSLFVLGLFVALFGPDQLSSSGFVALFVVMLVVCFGGCLGSDCDDRSPDIHYEDGETDFRVVEGLGDPGCADPLDDNELDFTVDCDDGLDNDFDGTTDFPDDSGCDSPADETETNEEIACDDGLDNDRDGQVDFGDDTGCDSLSDESDNTLDDVCDDGFDNDGDGFSDFQSEHPKEMQNASKATVGQCGRELNVAFIVGLNFRVWFESILHHPPSMSHDPDANQPVFLVSQNRVYA